MTFNPKSTLRRSQNTSDGIGLIGGFVVAAIAYGTFQKLPILSLAQTVFLLFVVGGAIVGSVAAMVTRWQEIPQDFRIPLGGRIGIRAGVWCAVTGAVLIIWLGILAVRGVPVIFAPIPFLIVPVLLSLLVSSPHSWLLDEARG